MKKEAKFMAQKAVLMSGVAAEKQGTSVSAASVAKVAPRVAAHDGIYGLYIFANEDYLGNSNGCDSIFVNKANVSDGTTTYNTQISMPYNNSAYSMYGNYDEATKKITVPVGQVIYTSADYGRIAAFGWSGSLDDLENMTIDDENPLVFTVEDDGSIVLDNLGIYMYMRDYAEKNPETSATWMNWFNPVLRPANAVMTYQTIDIQSETRYDHSNALSVEDFTYNINVYGMYPFADAYDTNSTSNGFGLSGIVTINVNQDLSVDMPSHQNIWAVASLGSGYDEGAGDYFYTQGVDLEQGKVEPDGNCPGVMADNQIGFQYVPVFTDWFETDSGTGTQTVAYGRWFYNNIITLDNGSFVAGINDVQASNAKKDSRMFNLAGQQVGKDFKGIVIMNGKKFLNK